MEKLTKILYFSDVHGSSIVYRKAINAAIMYKVDVLIFGGDITGKYIVPVFKKGNMFECDILGEHIIGTSEDIEKRIDKIGGYPYYTTLEEWNEISKSAQKMEELYFNLASNRLKKWINLAEENLKNKKISFYMILGNDDHEDLEKIINESFYVINANKKIVKIDENHEMLSLSYANITPWKCYGDKDEDYLYDLLDNLANKLVNPKTSIFNFHCPPYNTKIDLAPKLDENLRPVYVPGGEPEFDHVGCKSVRKIIEKYQPMLSLHGHIHESAGMDKIGRTMCFNAGSEYTASIFRGLFLAISDDKVKSYLFING